MILTSDELAALTRRDRPTVQARVLRLLGIPFTVHPMDGNLIVSRAAAEAKLGAPVGTTKAQAPQQGYDVDVERMRRHGQTSSAH
jgi:Domain of unknown function (DUF4224)